MPYRPIYNKKLFVLLGAVSVLVFIVYYYAAVGGPPAPPTSQDTEEETPPIARDTDALELPADRVFMHPGQGYSVQLPEGWVASKSQPGYFSSANAQSSDGLAMADLDGMVITVNKHRTTDTDIATRDWFTAMMLSDNLTREVTELNIAGSEAIAFDADWGASGTSTGYLLDVGDAWYKFDCFYQADNEQLRSQCRATMRLMIETGGFD